MAPLLHDLNYCLFIFIEFVRIRVICLLGLVYFADHLRYDYMYKGTSTSTVLYEYKYMLYCTRLGIESAGCTVHTVHLLIRVLLEYSFYE